MADGLTKERQLDMARQVYRLALKRAPDAAVRGRVMAKLGLLARPTEGNYFLFDLARQLETNVPNSFVGSGLATWFKDLPFYEEAKFAELADKHAHLLPLPNWHWNLQTAAWAVRQALLAEGDLVELGVFKGHTTLFVAEYLDFGSLPRRWFLYDTFDGIPDDQVDPGWKESNRIYKNTFSFEEVRDRFAHIPNISVIKGRVPEILQETSPERIAFMHVDLNNASAEIAALDALFDRVSPGGVILFDDYCWSVSRAQRRAEDQWFAARNRRILPLPTGQGLFIKT